MITKAGRTREPEFEEENMEMKFRQNSDEEEAPQQDQRRSISREKLTLEGSNVSRNRNYRRCIFSWFLFVHNSQIFY